MNSARRWRSSSYRFPITICRFFSVKLTLAQESNDGRPTPGPGTSTWTDFLLSLWQRSILGVAPLAQAPARAQDQAKPVEGFGESRRGDVPEGTLEMMTPETDLAITNGLAWLASQPRTAMVRMEPARTGATSR